MTKWAYCPYCGTRTDNEEVGGELYCTSCHKQNYIAVVRRENIYVEQAEIAKETVRRQSQT